MSDLHTARVATEPFDKRCGADVIFRTTDNVDFYLHKAILSLASTYFEGLFTLPPVTDNAGSATSDELPVVDVSEDSRTLDCLLRYCYPVEDPEMTDLKVLDSVLSAAIKYEFDVTLKLIVRALRGFVDTHTLHVYAMSCRHGCEDEARLAAETWKKSRTSWPDMLETFSETRAALCYIPEMASLPAGAYFRLIQFVAGDAVSKFCDPPTVERPPDPEIDTSCFPFNQPGADVVFRSTNDVDFRVHRLMVEMQIAANPTSSAQATLLAPPATNVTIDGLPVIETGETSYILQQLLKLCYPAMPGNAISSWSAQQCLDATNIRVIAAALKYGLSPIVGLYRDRFLSLNNISLESYCVCVSFGWHHQASAIAGNMSYASDSLVYHEKLEMLNAEEYHVFMGRLHTSWIFFRSCKAPQRR